MTRPYKSISRKNKKIENSKIKKHYYKKNLGVGKNVFLGGG
jgi:hypothetical protein